MFRNLFQTDKWKYDNVSDSPKMIAGAKKCINFLFYEMVIYTINMNSLLEFQIKL